jgi:Flp pilus assembly pilin Flp
VKTVKSLFKRIWSNDQGGEVIEYALVIGLIVIAAIAIIATVGVKVVGRWNSVDSSL